MLFNLRSVKKSSVPMSVTFSAAAGNLNIYDEKQADEEERRRVELYKEIDNMKGRGFTDPWDLEDLMNSKTTYADLPDWSPALVSRLSQERVKIHPDKIPTLSTLARIPLPPPPPPHPGHGQLKLYALQRKRAIFKIIAEKVEAMVEPEISRIKEIVSWEDKQDAVDELFERVEFSLREKEEILGKHPLFSSWVEKALEQYLQRVQRSQEIDHNDAEHKDSTTENTTSMDKDALPNAEQDSAALPVFLDCFSESDSEAENSPKILHPLKLFERGQNLGRMIEEWDLAAHKTSKRIMIRQCTRQIAQALEGPVAPRVFVHGQKGVGKTATLASVVASARKSGHIVMYFSDGDHMSKNGFYIEPNAKRPGIFDLPILSGQACQQLLDCHKADLEEFSISRETLEVYFTADQVNRLSGLTGEEMKLVEVLELAVEKTAVAPMCYAAAVDALMKQEKKPFLIVSDDFNSFFQPGFYFHADYDYDVKKAIPYEQISLFKPVLDAMALTADEGTDPRTPMMMKQGGIVVGISESRAVGRKITDQLGVNARLQASNDAVPMIVCEVPRLSSIEVEHMLANYEAIGFGKLRLDQGDVVLNDDEVTYLRVVSSGVAQNLMDVCIM
jgi:hypothetical protein